MDLASQLLMDPSPEAMGRVLIQQGIIRAIFCPYSGKVLDVSTAVVIDGSDYKKADGTRGEMSIMHFEVWKMLLDGCGSKEAVETALGFPFDLYDGRVLFKK